MWPGAQGSLAIAGTGPDSNAIAMIMRFHMMAMVKDHGGAIVASEESVPRVPAVEVALDLQASATDVDLLAGSHHPYRHLHHHVDATSLAGMTEQPPSFLERWRQSSCRHRLAALWQPIVTSSHDR